jgi:FkbM family methyltransferase
LKLQLARAQALLKQSKPKPDEAMKVLQPLVNRKNAPWPVYHYSGIAFLQKKEYATALSFLQESVRQGADEPETQHSISICYFNLGRYDEAEEHAKIALDKKPEFFKGWLHLGSLYRAQAKLDDALKCFQKANAIDPKSASVAYRIGEIYSDQGDRNKAYELYDIATQIDKEYTEAWLAMAQVERQRKHYAEAEECIYEVLNQNPKNLAARVELGEHFKHTGNYEKAISLYEKLVQQYPKMGEIRINYALCLQELGSFDESEKHYMIAFEDQPESFESLSNYLMGVHYNPDRTKEEIFEEHKLWDQHFAPQEKQERPVPYNTSRNKTLKLGFISGGFRMHPVGWMITKALENLPKNQFEVYCYTTNNIYDRVTKQIHKVSDKWKSVIGYNDAVIARMIKEDEIDILVELSGHSADTRLKTVALEPAPIIVKWVGGLFNTTGLKSVDYLITDHYETPAGEEKFYTEKLVRMPDDYVTFMPPEYAPEVGELPVVKNGYITFGCFNNPTKVNDEILMKWAGIMKDLPSSRLFLKSKQYDTEALRDRIIQTMEQNGVEADRIRFEGLSPHNELLDRYNEVDIALDPWPYSGGLTTCEALWMGVPVVTKPGPTFAGRHSTTHLSNAGLPELVTNSWDAYRKKVVELASDTKRLAELRSSLREQVTNSPIYDGERFGAHLSSALRQIWHQWVDGYENGEKDWQQHIDVEPLDENKVQRSAKAEKTSDKDNVTNMLDTIEKEMNGSIAENENEPVDPALTRGSNSNNGAHTNGAVSVNGTEKESAPNEQEPDVYKFKTNDGITICTPPDAGMMTPYVLLEQKQWYENEINFVRDYLTPGMTVLDAGAGFGVYALPAAKWVGSEGTVCAFEPGVTAKRHLEMSKLENGFDHLDVIGKALTDKNGKQNWFTDKSPELNRLDDAGEETVSAVTLDAWWQFEGEPTIDLIKIDVNGDEANVLAGSAQLLERESPLILLSITEQKPDAFADSLAELGYALYEYIPGPGLLAEHDAESGADPYMQNLIAVKENRLEFLKENGWLHDELVTPTETDADLWKKELSKLPWTSALMETWEKQGDTEGIKSYLQALNYLVAAERIDVQNSELIQPRSQKAVLLLGAAQILISLYNQGANSTSVVFTLVRTLNALGKRGQAIEVMQKLIESTKVGQENMNVELPFLLPIPEQDEAPIKTDLNKWLMVRTVEAWIHLKDVSTYFSGAQEQKLIEVLEGNVEVAPRVIRQIDKSEKEREGDSKINQITNTNGSSKKQKGIKIIHLCFNHVYAQSLSDLVEYVNENSVQKHELYIEKHKAIPDFSVDISRNSHSTIFDMNTNIEQIFDICTKADVDAVMMHGLFFDWQKEMVKNIGAAKHVAWKLWGGDLYNPIKAKNPIYGVMKHVNSVHARVEGDFEIIKQTYGEKKFCRFGYTFPGLYGDLPEMLEKESPQIIIVGNSGDPTNNHFEILELLASKADIQNYRILLPVAYNLNPKYRQMLVDSVKRFGLEEITTLHEKFIHPNEYFEIMMKAGMLITAHDRQQAIGSILTSIYSGNKTFVKKEILLEGEEMINPTWRFLNDHELQAQPFKKLAEVKKLSDLKKVPADLTKKHQTIIRDKIGLQARGSELIKVSETMAEMEI